MEIGTDKIGKKKLERKNWNWNALTDFIVPLTLPPNRDPLFFLNILQPVPTPFTEKEGFCKTFLTSFKCQVFQELTNLII